MADIVTSVAVDTLLQAASTAEIRTAAGLGNVDNTADASKPVSTAQAAADTAVANAAASALTAGLAAKQGLNSNLTAEAGLTGAADRISYYTGVGAKALATFTTFARSLVAAVDLAAAWVVLGLSSDAAAGTASLRTLGTAATAAASGRQSNFLAALAYAATVTLDASALTLDAEKTITLTGNITVNAPTSPTAGQVVRFWLLASGGARTLTLGGTIKLPTGITFDGVIASGSVRLLEIRYNGSAWCVTSNLEFV